MQIAYIFLLIFAVIIAVFAAFNGGNVTINLLFTQLELPQAVVIIGSAAIGAIIGYSADVIKRFKSLLRIKELEKKNKALEKELENFKNVTEDEMKEVATTENEESIDLLK